MRNIVILGSTGSIGVQALEVIAAHPDKFKVVGLSAGRANLELLFAQAKQFKVPIVGTTASPDEYQKYSPGVEVVDGEKASSVIASLDCDIVLNAITGSIGLGPTLAALKSGNHIALANKESLVAGGELVMAFGADRITPVDSEHSAIFQALLAGKRSEVKQLILTASGGAFRDRKNLNGVTLAEALTHPTWSMGPVVTINSATLMNKGLEIIEAHHLFNLSYQQITAVIHPQSVVHSMVEYIDGSTLAQLSPPNMKGPIGYALSYPDRVSGVTTPVDWTKSHAWQFLPIDQNKYPTIALAIDAGLRGDAATATLNAANEVAVQAFIDGTIDFENIVPLVASALEKVDSGKTLRDLADVSALEEDARRITTTLSQEIN